LQLLAGGVTHLDSPESLTVQLCYVNFDGKAALAASRKVGLATKIGDEFVLKNCGTTVEAIGVSPVTIFIVTSSNIHETYYSV